MAAALGSRHGSGRQRVFVLVDGDSAKGVFYTWEAAESFADEHQYSLDKLMEYETSSDHPDHLHLMAAKWDQDWIFQGEWSRIAPLWSTPPKRIRLDHYHAKGNSFHLLRQREFDWEEDLLMRINPMAPDSALESRAPTPSALPPEEPQWQPRVSPLKPLKPIQETETPAAKPVSGDKDYDAGKDVEKPMEDFPKRQEKSNVNTDYADLADSLMVDRPDRDGPVTPSSKKLPRILRQTEGMKQGLDVKAQSPEKPEPKPAEPEEPEENPSLQDTPVPGKESTGFKSSGIEPESELVLEIPKEEEKHKPVIQPKITEGKLKLRSTLLETTDEAAKPEEKSGDKPVSAKEAKISFKNKTGLRLKSKAAPSPIPSFKPTPVVDINPSGKSSVELAHSDHRAMADKKPVESEFTGKLKKIWSLKLLLTLAAVVICWSGGIFWVLRPEPTAASIVAEVITLSRARTIVIEPKMVFFQFDVDPVHQERYIQNLKLEPISDAEPISIPTYHALDTWEKPNVFIRPPYADVEVEEWWNLRKREIKYGFRKEWEDGSILILDFESDTIVGWAQAKLLPEILN